MHFACHAAAASTMHFNYKYADKQNVHSFVTNKNYNLRTCFFLRGFVDKCSVGIQTRLSHTYIQTFLWGTVQID